MTPQEFIINTLKGYFIDPKTCAISHGGCMYRASDGRKCALGKHIKDEAYHARMEDNNADEVLSNNPYCLTEEAEDMNFTRSIWNVIQRVHDCFAQKLYVDAEMSIGTLEGSLAIDLTELKDLLKPYLNVV